MLKSVLVFSAAVAFASAVALPFGNCGPWDASGLGNLLSGSGGQGFPGSSHLVDSSAFPSNIQFPPLPPQIAQAQGRAQPQPLQFHGQPQAVRLPNASSGLHSPMLSSSVFEARVVPSHGAEQRGQMRAQQQQQQQQTPPPPPPPQLTNFQPRAPSSLDGLFPPIPPLSALQALQSVPSFPQQVFPAPNVLPCGNF